MWKGITDKAQLAVQISRSIIILIFFIELLLRVVTGVKKMLNFYELIDGFLVLTAVIASIVWYVDKNKFKKYTTQLK